MREKAAAKGRVANGFHMRARGEGSSALRLLTAHACFLQPSSPCMLTRPWAARATFITASERSRVQFSGVILIVFGTNCSKQWRPRGAEAVTGNSVIPAEEQTIGDRCWRLNSVRLQTPDAGTVSHLWQFQPLQHLWKGIVTWKARIKYVTSIVHVLYSHLPLSSMKPTVIQISNLKCHILIEDFAEHPGWVRNPLEALLLP